VVRLTADNRPKSFCSPEHATNCDGGNHRGRHSGPAGRNGKSPATGPVEIRGARARVCFWWKNDAGKDAITVQGADRPPCCRYGHQLKSFKDVSAIHRRSASANWRPPRRNPTRICARPTCRTSAVVSSRALDLEPARRRDGHRLNAGSPSPKGDPRFAALLSVRPLFADFQLVRATKPANLQACELHMEPPGQQVHHQHQHRDELLPAETPIS